MISHRCYLPSVHRTGGEGCALWAGIRRFGTHPAVVILVIAPYFGEGLSGSTPPLELLLPWNFAFMAALYGCGALICREVAHRLHLGFTGLILLGVAYGVWEEALVDRYWFYPAFWTDSGVGSYSVAWHTNVLLAIHLTAFHTAISICSAVLVVEWLVPGRRRQSWATRPGLAVAAVVMAGTPVVYGEFDRRPPAAVLVAAAAILVAAVLGAVALPRRLRGRTLRLDRAPRRGLGAVACATVLSHWIATYGIGLSGIPWPIGVVIAVTPIVLGSVIISRRAVTGPYGSDGVRVVAGLLVFFSSLDVFVGLGGRYDLAVGGLVTAYAAHRLVRSSRLRAAGLGATPTPGQVPT